MPISEFEYIGNTIRQRRETLGLTQEYLAELAGVGVRTVRDLEQGKGKSLTILVKVAQTLGMTIHLDIKSVQ